MKELHISFHKKSVKKWINIIMLLGIIFTFYSSPVPVQASIGDIGETWDDATVLGLTGRNWLGYPLEPGIQGVILNYDHYWVFDVTDSRNYKFNMDTGNVYLNMQLYSSSHSLIASGTPSLANESLNVDLTPGVYFLVIRENDAGYAIYDLQWNYDGFSSGDALRVSWFGPSHPIEGYLNDDRTNDWYYVNWSSGQLIDINLEGEGSTDFDLYVYDGSNLSSPLDSSTSSSYPDTVTFTTQSSTTYIRVYRYSGVGEYQLTSQLSTLDPPSTITATDGSYTDMVYVNWSDVTNATSYQVYRCSTSSTSSCGSPLSSTSYSNYFDYSATPGTVYYYRAKACNSGGCSDFSNYNTGYAAVPIPNPPSTISASDGTYTDRVYIDWSSVTGATSYQIFRCTSSSTSSCGSALSSPTSSSYYDYGATPGVNYYYRAKACNSEGCSDFSNYNTGYRAMSPPSSISASDGSYTDRVYIDWSSVTGATSYQIFRCTTTSTSSCGSALSSPTSSYYYDYGANPGTTYYYRVKACSSTGCSDYSSYNAGYRALTPPLPPTSISASDGTYTDRVAVDWSDSSGATSYQIYRCTTSSTSSCGSAISSPSSSSYTDYGATPGSIYYYRAKACNSAGCSDFSYYDTGYRALTVPSTITASDGTYTDRVFVDWSDSSGATSYQIYRCTTSSTSSCGSQISSPSSSNYTDYGPTPGVYYYYRVKACGAAGCTDFSQFDMGYRAITPPSTISASDGTYTDRVYIDWGDSTGATSYQIFRCTSSLTSSCGSALSSPSSSYYNDYGATPGTTYYYRAKACSSAGCSDFSNYNTGYRALTPPAPPTSISASDGAYTDRVEIDWSDSSGATSYQIYRCTSSLTSSCGSAISSPGSSNYSDYGATPGVSYYYRAKACNSAGCSDFGNYDMGYRKLTPPATLSASDGTYTDRVYVDWSDSSGATSYQVFRCTSSLTSSCGSALGSPGSSYYNDYDATPGETYYYRAKACSSAGCSDFSSYNTGYRALTPPSPPSSISASDGTYTDRVNIDWGDSSGATYYQIYRCTTSSTSSCASSLSSPSSSIYNDYGATPGVAYYYRAKACNSAGCSDFSNYNSGYRALTTPSSISASDGTYTDRVNINWGDIAGATSYQVYRCTTSSTSSCGSIIGAPSSSVYNDYGATPGVTYYFRVKACSSTGCSEFSDYDNGYRTLTPPSSISASDGTYGDRVYITWNSVTGATNYQVYRCTSSLTSSCDTAVGTPGSPSYNDYGAVPGVTYYYRAKACGSAGCSDFSECNSGYRAITPPSPPSTISASDGAYTDRVEIDWSDSSYATSYQIYRCTTSSTSSCGSALSSPSSSYYDDYGVTPLVTYYYRAKACNSAGCSDFSTYDTGFIVDSPPSAPTSISATDGTLPGRVFISWSSASGASTYEVYRCSDSSTSSCGAPITSCSGTSHNDYDLLPDTIFFYRVIACNSMGCSGFSDFNTGYFDSEFSGYQMFLPLIKK